MVLIMQLYGTLPDSLKLL